MRRPLYSPPALWNTAAMRVHRRLDRLPPEARGCAVAIGNFDGVHLGHRSVVAEARALAELLGRPAAVLTFEPHPRELVDPENAPPRLSPFARKARLLRDLGIGHLFVLRFCRQVMELSAEAFVEEVLAGWLDVGAVAVGADFRFGRRRAGDPALLERLLAPRGVKVAVLSKLAVNGRTCSSTAIREALAAGDPALAAELLGAPYELAGSVVHGDGLGRRLGVPTANVKIAGPRALLPACGVYVVRAAVRGEDGSWSWHPGVASLGWRPAVGGRDLRLEVHFLDGEHYLYGRCLRVAFLEYLREERDFPDLDALAAAMRHDIETARAWHAGRRAVAEPTM